MQLEGIHHVTAITGNAPQNVDFYVRVLGLRLVKKTVNQDDPTVYHLFYADEQGSPGQRHHVLRVSRCAPRPGGRRDGAHGRVPRRLARRRSTSGSGGSSERGRRRRAAPTGASRFEDPEGIRLELRAVATPDAPLVAEHPEIPAELALQGFDGVRAFAADPEASRALLEQTLGFAPVGDGAWEVRGESRGGLFAYDAPPAELAASGAPARCTTSRSRRRRTSRRPGSRLVTRAGLHPTPVIDRFWFRSIYFREPSGVLFELATLGPGLRRRRGSGAPRREADPAARVRAPARPQIEPVLTPIENPRTAWARSTQ